MAALKETLMVLAIIQRVAMVSAILRWKERTLLR